MEYICICIYLWQFLVSLACAAFLHSPIASPDEADLFWKSFGTGGGNLVPSGHFKRGPRAGPKIHFDGTGDIGASPNGNVERPDGTGSSPSCHFECSGGIGKRLGSRFERCGTSGASPSSFRGWILGGGPCRARYRNERKIHI